MAGLGGNGRKLIPWLAVDDGLALDLDPLNTLVVLAIKKGNVFPPFWASASTKPAA